MSSRSTTNRTNSRSSSARSRYDARVMVQTPIDAKLASDFDESRRLFDYSSSVDFNLSASTSNIPSSTVSTYLQKIQRGSLIQSFGCLIAVDEQTFSALAYSENAPEMLDLAPHSVPNMEQQEALAFGTDIRTLFRLPGAAALQKAANFPEVSLLNPILLHCKNTGKPFYAILHRIDVGLVIDFEPVNPTDVPVTAAGALKSYKLAAKAISRLQSLPSGNILNLCDVLVKEVRDLTGYDRVMVYKFHEDEHGEVISECCRPDLDPYLGLHYPATDIPQASRFLFMKNKVRMICDCFASPIKVIQDMSLIQPLSLGGSTLRAPHGCHAQYMANMGSIASLVMAVTINDDDDEGRSDKKRGRKLWGLVVCHHTSPKFVPFLLRYACELLVQVFGVQINKELELEAQVKEKHILRTQTVLCDMLLRDSPVAIVTQTPNVMDLVKCNGAALYFKNKTWLLGVTPSNEQVKDIACWLLEYHGSSTGLSTDSLREAGYPGASKLGDYVCGMAAVRISAKDFLFWFRSPTEKEIKWGGAKHDPIDKDDGRKMQPRSSFKAFLEVVKWRCLPWEDMEMDSIHSLQLIVRGSLNVGTENPEMGIIDVPLVDGSIQRVDELRTVTSEMVRLIQTAVVPVFAVDNSGVVNGWNIKAAELTGLPVEEAIGAPLINLVLDKNVDAVKSMLSLALQGMEEKNIEIRFKTFGPRENDGPTVFIVNACCSRDINENILGVCFIAQDITTQKIITDKYTQIQGDYIGIIRNPCPLIPPIFMMDDHGLCLEWNDAIEKLSGLTRKDAIGHVLLGEVFTVSNFGCRVQDQDTLTRLKILLNRVISGDDSDKLLFRFFDKEGKCIDVLLSATPRVGPKGTVTGVLCFLHVPSPELHYAIQMQKVSEEAAANSVSKLAYTRQLIRSPVNGVVFTRNLMESSDLNEAQRRLLKTRALCEEQLAKIVDDTDISSIEECYTGTNTFEFNLGEALDAVVSQVMPLSLEHRVQLIRDSPNEVSMMHLYGDNLRLQQVLSDFLANAVRFSVVFEGSAVVLTVIPRKERLGETIQVAHVEFRVTHPAPGIPEDLIEEMFYHSPGMSREGLGLYLSQKLVRVMNGTVQYLRGEESSSFVVAIEFPLVQDIDDR